MSVRLYQEQESQKRFAQEAENFSNMVYEQSDTLAPVVEKYGIKAQTLKGLTAEGPSGSRGEEAHQPARRREPLC